MVVGNSNPIPYLDVNTKVLVLDAVCSSSPLRYDRLAGEITPRLQ